MSFEAMKTFHNSVIEHEVSAGILACKGSTKSSCLVFLRDIKNVNLLDNRGGEPPQFFQVFCLLDISQGHA